MFSKAKRFDELAKKQANEKKKSELENSKTKSKVLAAPCIATKPKTIAPANTLKSNNDTESQCSSVRSVKSFATPKPIKSLSIPKTSNSLKKINPVKKVTKLPNHNDKVSDDIIKAQEVEIRNKDYTISEYNKQIEDLKNEINNLQKQLKIETSDFKEVKEQEHNDNTQVIEDLKIQISTLEQQCNKLEIELSNKQVELSSLEEVICIRDSLCQDLQAKLTNSETCLEETRQRLEMVKGHHALALEANESIRREYKAELETIKSKLEEEKQTILNKSKAEQESVKIKYNNLIESIKTQLGKEKDDAVYELQVMLNSKDDEMKAKLEQIDEATHEKLRLCEIQFEERYRSIQEHWSLNEEKVRYLEKETKDLRYTLHITEEQNKTLKNEINSIRKENEVLETQKCELEKQIEDLKDESKTKFIDFENQINKLTVEVDKAAREKSKFEMSLSVTRDIVDVLTMRLRESDNEVENLDAKLQSLTDVKEELEEELSKYKNTLNNTILECNEYKEALINILKSKAALAKEHTRIMEHNVSLIESLQNVEKEAYCELGSIKNEFIEDVEMLKKESTTQICKLREEVEEKRKQCLEAREQLAQTTAAAEAARALLGQAAAEIARLEGDQQRLALQIQDQQSLVVELSLLRQENEELSMTVAKQSSIIDKMKKDMEQTKPKSPSVIRKNHKIGKENTQIIISPLRERNH